MCCSWDESQERRVLIATTVKGLLLVFTEVINLVTLAVNVTNALGLSGLSESLKFPWML